VGFAAIAALLTLLAIPLWDLRLARGVRESGVEGAWLFSEGTRVLDLVTGKEVSKFLLGMLLLASGAGLSAFARTRRHARMLLLVGAVQLLSTLACGVAKNVFGRLRPFEVLGPEVSDPPWFVGGSSFPSGHTGFYFGLCLPLAWLFPRWRWPLLAVPLFIAVARVVANDHFSSDVTASMGVAALLTLAGVRALGPHLRPGRGGPPVAGTT
jgi:membrane-associated phospholipid phosphatase